MRSATIIASFLIFLALFVAIGAYATTRAKATTGDYLLAGRDVNPWLAGLSAVATQNSGFMFIGMIGLTYAAGVSSIWLLIGSLCGTYLAWLFVLARLRRASGEQQANTIPGFLAGPAQDGVVAVFAGLLTVVFLGTYAAAQLTAGSKALHVLFGWSTWVGAAIGALIIIAYCFAGGIRASIWTDTAQSVVMLIAMLVLVGQAVAKAGGVGALWLQLEAIDPKLTQVFPSDLRFGFAPYFLGWVVAGFGVVGQPHVMVRAMAIRSVDDVPVARRIYHAWFVLFCAASVGVGLACRVLLPASPTFDAELALPRLSLQLLSPVLVGVVLAGLFAATTSTADSQVLSCSASLTQDIFPRWRDSYLMGKIATVGVALIAFAIALGAIVSGNASVFTLVVFAWASLASTLGPLMLLRILGITVRPTVAVAMMIAGIAMVMYWRYGLQLSHSVFEVLPGMATGFVVYALARVIQRSRRRART